jgi:hypothetical protein
MLIRQKMNVRFIATTFISIVVLIIPRMIGNFHFETSDRRQAVRRRLHERDIVVLADALQHEEGR